jgi:hypothetical protein
VIIKKDEISGVWIVWKKEGSLMTEVFRAKTKKKCEGFVKNER